MAQLTGKKYLSFQAKVLLPVVAVLALLLSVFVWLVNQHLMRQSEEEANHTLTTAEVVFRNSFDIRTRNLLLRYQNFVNEPRFKAVAQLAEAKTMTMLLNEFLNEIDPDTEVMIFTPYQEMFVAGARREAGMDLEEFRSRSSLSIRRAQQGQTGADTIAIGKRLFNVISVPVIVNESPAGVLTIGVRVGTVAAQELKLLTRSEITFVANGAIAVSTVQDSKSNPQLIAIFKKLITAPPSKTAEVLTPGGEHFLGLAGRLGNSNNIGYLLLSSYEKALHGKQLTQRTLTVLSLAGILFSSLLIWVLIRKITRPLRELRDSAEAVGRGDFSRHVEVQSNDEYGELATVFNRMMENLTASQSEVQRTLQTLKNTQAQLVQTEKLSAIGEFVAGVAHELNNPLTGVIGFSEMLRESGMNERQQNYLNRLVGSAERCHRIVQSLLSFARRHRPERKRVGINQLLESAIEILGYELRTGNIEVITELSPAIPNLLVDPHQIQQVFLNILNNSRQAMDLQQRKGLIRVRSQLEDGRVRIIFQDNGPGISSENLSKIFNPFFTTKPVGEGTGLGLSLSYGIIREHGGTLTAQSQTGDGVTFIIDLPITPDEQELNADKTDSLLQSTVQHNGLRSRILVIDDEEYILDLIREALKACGYQVDIAADGKTAIDLAAHDQYDLIICDWKIPDIGGQLIYERLRELKPQATQRFIFITGDILSEKAEQFLHDEGKICLFKPFSIEQFRTTIQEVLTIPS